MTLKLKLGGRGANYSDWSPCWNLRAWDIFNVRSQLPQEGKYLKMKFLILGEGGGV